MCRIAQEAPFGRNAVQMHVEQLALPVSDGEIAHRRVRNTLSVVLHRSGENIKCGIVGHRLVDYLCQRPKRTSTCDFIA